jgi:hypothetical protein
MLTSIDYPKTIYHCDFPDCHRSFIRQDVCARHREEHEVHGQLGHNGVETDQLVNGSL